MTIRNKRGRVSSAELASIGNVTVLPARPRPPASLSVAESTLFAQIVGSLPVDWFTAGNLPLLVAYVQSCALLDRITVECDRYLAEVGLWELPKVPPIFKLRESTASTVMMLATKLRLSNQSRFDKRVAANVARKGNQSKLWDPAKRSTLPKDRDE